MDFRLGLGLLLLLLALALTAESSSFTFDDPTFGNVAGFDLGAVRANSGTTCNGRVGECIDDAEEMMLDSESNRRQLRGRGFISYGAMRRNNVPCNRRGRSYYNCNSRGRANPYRRSCNVITKCGHRR